jgi:hypothetical protein
MIEFVSNECPSVSAWLIACRSIARLAARRTRRSCHGDFGSHWSTGFDPEAMIFAEDAKDLAALFAGVEKLLTD